MSTALFDLSGRRALITGSSRGIGLALAEGLAAAGAEVILNARDPVALERARDRITATGAKAYMAAFDVSAADAVDAAIDRIESTVGPIDILFNNAGMQMRAPLADYPVDVWHKMMAVNVDSVFFVGRAVARRMIPRGRGKIVNTCSLTSEVARMNIAPYTTSKGAVKMLTKSMATEWAPHGIQVNGIGPGYFRTELNRALVEDPVFDAWVKKRTPAGRWGETNELQGAAIFLASDASNFVTGQIIYVDGGLLATM